MFYLGTVENLVLHDLLKYLNAFYLPDNHGSNKYSSTAHLLQHFSVKNYKIAKHQLS